MTASPAPAAGRGLARWRVRGALHSGDRLSAWLADPVLWLVVAISTATRLFFAMRFEGFLGGDDVELLEEAFHRAVDLAYQPWAIRNLLLPDLLLAPAVRLAAAVGIAGTDRLLLVAALPFVVLASLNVFLVFRLAWSWRGSRALARLAAAIYAFHWLPLGFGSLVYPRNLSTTCILVAALSVSGQGRGFARGTAAGALLSLAFADRYSEGMFLLPLLATCWLCADDGEDARRRSYGLAAGFTAGALVAVGVYDWLTWGRPFASLLAFAKYTLVEKQASKRLATQPLLFYFERLLYWLPPTLWPPLVVAWRRRSRQFAWAFLLLPVAVLSLVHHKELRYLQAVVPFLAILGAAGLDEIRHRGHRAFAAALLVLTLAAEAYGVRFLADRSAPAVRAARRMSRDPAAKVVVLSQPWAFGDRLFLGNGVEIREVATPPSADELRCKLPGADFVSLYADDIADDPALAPVLVELGFRRQETFAWGEARTVVLFGRN